MKHYIIKDFMLRDIEKKYLISKIDGFRSEYLKGLGNGNFDIFKLPKRIICFENIYFLICLSNNGDLKNKRVKKKIIINVDRTFIKKELKNNLKDLLDNNAR